MQDTDHCVASTAQIVHDCLQRYGKNGSMENVMQGGTISKKNFIIGVRSEFGVPGALVESHLSRFYDAFEDQRCYRMLFTYLSITFCQLIMDNPSKALLHFCDICSDSQDTVHVADLHSVINLGRTSEQAVKLSTLNDWIQTCCGQSRMMRIDQSILQDILDLAPSLVIQFRDNVRNQLTISNRLRLISETEVRVGRICTIVSYIRICTVAGKPRLIQI